MAKAVSIIVLCHGRWGAARRCLESLRRSTDPRLYEVLVYDNASPDGTLAGLKALARGWPQLRVFSNARNLPFSEAVNRGMRDARGDHFLWLNNDTVLSPGWLEGLLTAAGGQDVAAAGPMTDHMAAPDQLCKPFRSRSSPRPAEANFLGGFCFLLKRSAAELVGPLDERFVWGWEDIDFCLRLRQAGKRLMLARGVFVRHEGSRTLSKMARAERERSDLANRSLLTAKWRDELPLRTDLARLIARCPAPWQPPAPTVSVIVVCRENLGVSKRCLDAVRRCEGTVPYEVVTASLDGGAKAAAGLKALALDWPQVKHLGDWTRIPYSHAVNLAMRSAQGDYRVVLADDFLAAPSWLEGLVGAAKADSAAVVVGPKCDGLLLAWQGDDAAEGSGTASVRYVRDACLLITRAAWSSVGELDDRFQGLLGAEDYCLRARQRGFHVLLAGGVRLKRIGDGGSVREKVRRKDARLMFEKWSGHPLFPMEARL